MIQHRTDLPRLDARNLIVCADLSLTSTGIAWLDEDGYIGVTTQRAVALPDPARAGWGPSIRRTRITTPIKRRLSAGCLFAKEDRLSTLQVKGNSALDIAALHATAEDIAQVRDVPVVNINVGRVKVYGSNTGKATKDMQVEAARRELGRYVQVENDDEADVLWVLAITCHVAGLPIVRITKRRAEIAHVCRADWPSDALWRKEDMPTAVLSRLRSTL